LKEADVKALVFRHSLAREAAAAMGGSVSRRAYVSWFAPTRLEDVAEPPLPARDWVSVETTLSGLCGSDVKQILLNGARDNPLTALVSFPHVLGHEAVGRRADTGDRVMLAALRGRFAEAKLLTGQVAAEGQRVGLAGTERLVAALHGEIAFY
jgi:threonine dehydrogenase-like Zn-dependent dehydrogenase